MLQLETSVILSQLYLKSRFPNWYSPWNLGNATHVRWKCRTYPGPFFWPCGDCRGNCTQNSVQCDTCQSWYHYNCQNLSMEDLEYLVKATSSFTCLICSREEIETPFSFTTSLQRLSLVCVRWKYSLIIKRYKTNNNIQCFN